MVEPQSAFDEWVRTVSALTESADAAEAWRQRRWAFASCLGDALVAGRPGRKTGQHVIYGVWLSWGALYVGQTTDPCRRLRDLPVGESHHLTTTFPPETWDRVLVLDWPELPEAATVRNLDQKDVGLGLEHRVQSWLRPIFNGSRRARGGRWRPVEWDTSQSRGARVGTELDELFLAVQSVFRHAAVCDGGDETEHAGFRLVFPPRILADSKFEAPPAAPSLRKPWLARAVAG